MGSLECVLRSEGDSCATLIVSHYVAWYINIMNIVTPYNVWYINIMNIVTPYNEWCQYVWSYTLKSRIAASKQMKKSESLNANSEQFIILEEKNIILGVFQSKENLKGNLYSYVSLIKHYWTIAHRIHCNTDTVTPPPQPPLPPSISRYSYRATLLICCESFETN